MAHFINKEILIARVNLGDSNYETLCFQCKRITGAHKNKSALAIYPILDEKEEAIPESIAVLKAAGYSENEIKRHIDHYKKYHKILSFKESFYDVNTKHTYDYTLLNNIKRCNSFDELSEICNYIYETYGSISKYSSAISNQIRIIFTRNPNLDFYKETSYTLADERVYPFLFKMTFVISIYEQKERFTDAFKDITREAFAKNAFDYMMDLFYRKSKIELKQLRFFEIVYSSFNPFNYSISALDQIYYMQHLHQFSNEMIPFIQTYRKEIFNYKKNLEEQENNVDYFTAMEKDMSIDPIILTKAKTVIKEQNEFDKWNYFKKKYEEGTFNEKSYVLSKRYLVEKNKQNIIALLSLINCIDNREILCDGRLDKIHSSFYFELQFYLVHIKEKLDDIILEINQLYYKYSLFYSELTKREYNRAMDLLIRKKQAEEFNMKTR